MTNDMTSGRPARLILLFSLPLLAGNLFQQFYNMADTIIVGRTVGVNALAAVGATGSINFLILGFVMGVTSGFAVVTAQRFGAGDEAGVRRSVATSIILSIAVTAVVTLISVLGTMPLLRLMNTPEDIIDDAYSYIVVIFLGIAASVLFNLFSCILRSLGDSRTPLIFLIIACLLNIGLDFACILIFKMGVAGAAWATIAAQLIAGLLCMGYSFKRFPILRLHKEDFKFDWAFAWHHLRIGLPMAFQFSITAVGTMVLQAALNNLGSASVAAFTAASKIDQLASQPLQSLGTAMATYAAQNYGAGQVARIRKGVRSCCLISTIASLVGGGLVILAGPLLIRLFVGDAEQLVYDRAQEYLIVLAIFYTVLGLLFVFRNTLQGVGSSSITLFAGVSELLMRSFAAIFLAQWMGYLGICLASPIAWIGAMVPLSISYFLVIRKLPAQFAPRSEA